jgi:hypothetical protein
MLPPTTYAAVACYAVGSFVSVALEYIAFLRRPRRAEPGEQRGTDVFSPSVAQGHSHDAEIDQVDDEREQERVR